MYFAPPPNARTIGDSIDAGTNAKKRSMAASGGKGANPPTLIRKPRTRETVPARTPFLNATHRRVFERSSKSLDGVAHPKIKLTIVLLPDRTMIKYPSIPKMYREDVA